MSDPRTQVRSALVEVVPSNPATDGLADAARRYAAHAQRVRHTVVVLAAVALVVGGAVASGAFRDRAVAPGPVTALSCGMDAPDLAASVLAEVSDLGGSAELAASRATGGFRAPMPGSLPWARQVLVCADRSSASVWPGSLPPDQPVSDAVDVAYLRLEPRSRAQDCGGMPTGPAYRMLLLGADGVAHGVDNDQLRCNGWPALDRYFVALGDQMSARWGAADDDPFPRCPSVLQAPLSPREGAAPALGRDVALAQATACFHPLADPARLPRAVLPVTRAVLGADQLAQLDTALAGGSRSVPQAAASAGCAPLAGGEVVVHATTQDGQELTLSQACASGGVLAVDGNLDDRVMVTAGTWRGLLGALGHT